MGLSWNPKKRGKDMKQKAEINNRAELKAEWLKDETLQADFPDFEDYVAYLKPVKGVEFKNVGGIE